MSRPRITPPGDQQSRKFVQRDDLRPLNNIELNPGLEQLLKDVSLGEVQIVIVYKVDRLTRSLADFAKMVELFDTHGVSFVSVTQQFNTTTSMGRLTLNVLLSFAQFEREVTGERIRDKIAASKKKGMWMGGVPPLGYEVRNRKLVVNKAEAEQVKEIFNRYLQLGSVHQLRDALRNDGVLSRKQVYRNGRQVGGKPFGRGALYHLLQNRTYLGEIVHKKSAYPGQHDSIIHKALWDKVQGQMEKNRVARAYTEHANEPSLLAGLVFDSKGRRLTPSHTVKNGKRYRYYVTQALTVERRSEIKGARRIPAGELESIVCEQLKSFFADGEEVTAALENYVEEADTLASLLTNAGELSISWKERTPTELRALVRALMSKVSVYAERVVLEISIPCLHQMLNLGLSNWPSLTSKELDANGPTKQITVAARLKRAGIGTRMVVGSNAGVKRTEPNAALMDQISKAYDFRRRLLKSPGSTLKAVAKTAGVTPSYFTRLLRLAYLTPDITQAIVDGKQPATLTARVLAKASRLPLDWDEQRRLLGFK